MNPGGNPYVEPPAIELSPGADPVLFHNRKGVLLGISEWQNLTEKWLRWYGLDAERTARLPRCGTGMQVPVCRKCGVEDRNSARRTADCEMRICPRCARQKAQERRECIRAAVEQYKAFGKSGGWFMHTVPVPRNHGDGTTIGRLRKDFEGAWSAWKAGWKWLQKHAGAQIAYASLEVSPGGLVHVHVMCWHKWIDDFEAFRRVVLSTLHRRGYKRAVFVHSTRITGKDKDAGDLDGGINEVAKYLTKGVAVEEHDRYKYGADDCTPRQTHPALCAQVEIAFKGRRTWRQYGKLREEPAAQQREDAWQCPNCGCAEHRLRYELPQEASCGELAAMIRDLSLAAATVIVPAEYKRA